MRRPAESVPVTFGRTLRAVFAAVAGTAVMVVSMASLGAVRPAPPVGATAVILLLSPIAAVPALFFLYLRTTGAEHRIWRAAVHASIALLLGESAEVLMRIGAPGDHSVIATVRIVAFVLAGYFGAIAARRIVGQPESTEKNALGHWLDISTIFFGVFLLMLTLLIPGLRDTAGAGWAQGTALALLPSLSVALVVYVTIFKRTPWMSWQVLATAWVAFMGTKDALAAVTTSAEQRLSPPGSPEMLWVDALLIFGYALGIASAVERMLTGEEARPRCQPPYGPVWPSLAAPGVLIASAPIIFTRMNHTSWSRSDIWTIVVLGVFIGLTTTVRSYLIATENALLRHHSTTDPLTGLDNHRSFRERLELEVKRAERAETPLAVVAVDVDEFDRVNNVYGHTTGDNRLRTIAQRLRQASRASDAVCRTGGDEFAMIMPETTPLEAYRVCLRLQDGLSGPDGVCPLPISLSVGVAGYPEHATSADELAQLADAALYWAKFHGREQIVVYDPKLIRSLGPQERIARLEEESYLHMVRLLSSAVDARDSHTHEHARRVSELCVALAQELGFDDSETALVETAALLHDVGKIGVPDSVLRKPGPLDDEELLTIRAHPQLAVRMLGAIPKKELLPWIAAHHERWDGTGYPDGLAGDAIPLQARMLALCDSFESMTSARPYRGARSFTDACDEICACAGTQFDPALAKRFVGMLVAQGPEAHGLSADPA